MGHVNSPHHHIEQEVLLSTHGSEQHPNISDLAVTDTVSLAHESDKAYLERLFRQSVAALERVGALAPDEFDGLVRSPARTDLERDQRAEQHRQIAQRALTAVQDGAIAEEDFNIWSGRRKEDGCVVKYRFERIYQRCCTRVLTHRRGALTGIVRAYQHAQAELVDSLAADIAAAKTPEELLHTASRSVDAGFLVFQRYTNGTVAGWPIFTRSTGRLRGAMRLRALIDTRQKELPMSAEFAAAVMAKIAITKETGSAVGPQGDGEHPFQRLLESIRRMFSYKR